jgi:outer membrane protein insertion porin family
VLRSLIRQRPGEPLSLKTLYEDQRRIRSLDIVEQVDFQAVGLKEQAPVVHLFCHIEERPPYYVQAGVGYESDRGLYTQARAGDRNFLGINDDLWLQAGSSETGYSVEVGIADPHLMATPIRVSAGLFVEKEEPFNQNFGTRSTGATMAFSHDLSDRLRAGVGFLLERREQFLTDAAEPGDLLEFQPRTLVAVTPSVTFDTRDSFLKPRRGMFSTVSVGFHTGLENDLDDFVRYHADIRWYRSLLERLTLAFMTLVGYIDPYNVNDRVPDDQLFFLGGTTTVRGFDENLLLFDENGEPAGGRWSVTGTVEARIDMGNNLELALFYDTGRLGDVAGSAAGGDEFRSSVGAGIRYQTPIGPMGLLYGWKLDPKEGESPGRVHVSVGYTF